jgi:hypothetical protein
MGTLKLQARNGAVGNLVPHDNTESEAKFTLPKQTGNLATLEDIKALTDLDVKALSEIVEQVEENKQDIVELEEEIDALAPTFDRGQWEFKAPANPTDSPEEATYFTLDGSGAVSTEFSNTAEILFHNDDATEASHTWAGVEEGQYIEMFDAEDGEFLLAEIDEVTLELDYVKFAVTVKQSEGGPAGMPPDLSEEHRVRIKIFEIPEVDVSTLMPKAGGTFTGQVVHTKEIHTKPAGTNRFVTLKAFPPKDPETDEWDYTSKFGINVDLDHGNSGTNSFKFSNRAGDMLVMNGGSNPAGKYYGAMTEDKHLVNKKYVDDKASGGSNLMCLASPGGGFQYLNSASSPPSYNQFSANEGSTTSNKNWHFYNLYDNMNNSVMAKDYEKTDSTMLEIWNQGSLRVRTTLRAWETSPRSANVIEAICSGPKPSTALGATLSGSSYYDIIITNLRKK